MKRSLFVSLAMVIAVTVVAIMSLHGAFTYLANKKVLQEEIRERAELSMATLKENMAGLMDAYAVNEYEKLVRTEMELRDLFAIVVEDRNMGRVLGTETYVTGMVRNGAGRLVAYEPENPRHRRELERAVLSMSAGIGSPGGGGTLGKLTIYMSGEAIDRELERTVSATLLNTLLISALLIGSLFFSIKRFVLQPLADMAEVIEDSDEDGIPKKRIATDGSREFRTLGDAVNRMVETVRSSRAELKKLNENLHARVETGIRENMRLEGEKLEQEKLLIQQSRFAAMGEMMSAIAHQWRQPLNALGISIQDLQDAKSYGELDDGYLKEMVERSMKNIRFMSRTIDDFRNFFKPHNEKTAFSVNEALETVKNILEAQLEAHGIALEIRGEQLTVEGYKNEFQQVLLVVLNNAKEAILHRRETEPGLSGKVTVTLEAGRVEISDNGGGIPEEIMEKVFDPYFSTKPGVQGTGIGLYMARTIMQRNMGGEIRAFNREGGAVFELLFPA